MFALFADIICESVAERALAICNLRAVPGTAPPTPMLLFQNRCLPSFNVGTVARRIHPIPHGWNDADFFNLVRFCGPLRFAYIHPDHGGIVHFNSDEEAKATEIVLNIKLAALRSFQPMKDTIVRLSVSSDLRNIAHLNG